MLESPTKKKHNTLPLKTNFTTQENGSKQKKTTLSLIHTVQQYPF
jgi:hypothetical protein